MSKKISVLVIGRLGELVKKLYEIETILEKDPSNEIAVLELASYASVLESWPIADVANFEAILFDFKLELAKLTAANTDFEASIKSSNPFRLDIDACAYLKAREAVKTKMANINDLGRYVGNVPLLDITMDKEQQ